MPFDLNHWRNPRATIATSLRSNDLAYATHGALQVGVMLRKLGALPPATATLLDYGCGTGRIGRCATSLFAGVWGYDPVTECVAHGQREALPLATPNLLLTSDWSAIPECDYGMSVNVMEHLDRAAQDRMVQHLRERVRKHTVIWYRPATNGDALAKWLTDKDRKSDDELPESIQVRALRLRS